MDLKRRSAMALLMCSSAAACVPSGAPRCAVGQRASVHETLYFGTGKPDGVVTPQEWSQFVTNMITPRFPSGFTTFDAAGQWRATDGSIVKEATYVLDLVHADDPQLAKAAGELVTSYKEQFHQEAVLRIRTESCVSF